MNDSVAPQNTRPLRHASGRRIVSERFVGALCAMAEAVFSTEAGPPDAERIAWLSLEIEDLLARSGARTRWLLRVAVFVVGLLAPLFVGRLPPLGRLEVRERARALKRLETSSFGAPVLAVKALLCVLYYEHPQAALEVGFDGACLSERRSLELVE